MTDLAQALCAALVLLVPLAGAGLALMNSGLGRSRSAAHAMLAPVCVMAVAVLAYFVCGWSWQSYPGRPAHFVLLGGKWWNWLAAEPFFLRGLALDGSPAALAAWLEMFNVALALAAAAVAGIGGQLLALALLKESLEFTLDFRQNVMISRHPCVQGRQEEDAHRQIGNQPTDDHDREWPLRVRPYLMRQRGGQQSQRRYQHCHHDGAQPQHRAFDRRILDR